jgi:hypothetical protein
MNDFFYYFTPLFIGVRFNPSLQQTLLNNRFSQNSDVGIFQDSVYLIDHFERAERYHAFEIGGETHVSVGLGRLYEVKYAAAALNMIDRVEEICEKKLDVSKRFIDRLAQLIQKRKARFVYDKRKAHIANIDTLYSFFIPYINSFSRSSELTMELDDQWHYACVYSRLSGFRWRLAPGVDGNIQEDYNDITERSWKDTTSTDTFDQNAFDKCEERADPLERQQQEMGRRAVGEYYIWSEGVIGVPLNRFWQFDADLSVKYSLYKKNTVNNVVHSSYTGYREEIEEYPELYIEGGAQCSYYPSTRSRLSMRCAGEYMREFDYGESVKIEDSERIKQRITSNSRAYSLKLNMSLDYYLSPQVRYAIICKGNYHRDYDIDSFRRDTFFRRTNDLEKMFEYSVEARLIFEWM